MITTDFFSPYNATFFFPDRLAYTMSRDLQFNYFSSSSHVPLKQKGSNKLRVY